MRHGFATNARSGRPRSAGLALLLVLLLAPLAAPAQNEPQQEPADAAAADQAAAEQAQGATDSTQQPEQAVEPQADEADEADEAEADEAEAEASSEPLDTAEIDPVENSRLGLRVDLKVGGIIPRTEMNPAVGGLLGLNYALPLNDWLDSDSKYLRDALHVLVESGYHLVAKKSDEIIPGRGQTSLIQNTHVIPIHLGALYRGPQDWSLRPYGGAALGMFITMTDFHSFSETESQNRFSVGPLFIAGGEYDIQLSPSLDGHFFLEVQHREAWPDVGEFNGVGEDRLGATSVFAGFGLGF